MTLKLRMLRSLTRLFIILVSLTRSLFCEKMLISNRCFSGLMPNLIKKSWTVSSRGRGKKRDTKFVTHILKWQLALVWRPMGNFWATNLCLETTLNGMLSHKCFGYSWVPDHWHQEYWVFYHRINSLRDKSLFRNRSYWHDI